MELERQENDMFSKRDVIIIIICILFSIVFANILVDDETDINRYKYIIEMLYTDEFNEEVLSFDGMRDFKDKMEKSEKIYVPFDKCMMGSSKNYNENISQELEEFNIYLEDNKNTEENFFESVDIGFYRDSIVYNKIFEKLSTFYYNDLIEVKEYNDEFYLKLNDFNYKSGYYEIILDGVSFRVLSEDVVLTYQMYIDEVIKNKDVFTLEKIENEKYKTIYYVRDIVLNKNFNIVCYTNLFNEIVDIEINIPYILGDSEICFIL